MLKNPTYIFMKAVLMDQALASLTGGAGQAVDHFDMIYYPIASCGNAIAP